MDRELHTRALRFLVKFVYLNNAHVLNAKLLLQKVYSRDNYITCLVFPTCAQLLLCPALSRLSLLHESFSSSYRHDFTLSLAFILS